MEKPSFSNMEQVCVCVCVRIHTVKYYTKTDHQAQKNIHPV